jgi:hypothetical protein
METRDAKVALAHLVRAEAYRRAGNFGKVAQHQKRAGWFASRAARGVDSAFGASECARQIARLLGAKAPSGRGIPSLGWTCYMSAALQCLFVTAFEVDKEHKQLRDAYNALKAACAGDTDPDKATVGRVHSALRAAFLKKPQGSDVYKLANAMEIKERGEERRIRSAAIDMADFLPALLECGCGSADTCSFVMHTVVEGMHELSSALVDSIPTVLCVNAPRFAGTNVSATLVLNVNGTRYDLVAVPFFDAEEKHNVAYTQRGGKWTFYDGTKEVRMLDSADAKLKAALKTSNVYVYQKSDAGKLYDSGENGEAHKTTQKLSVEK